MQLVAYGAQDVYLTGNPQITFFKVVYRRHTNFAMEAIEQTFNGTVDFGKKVTCTISRNGDLIHRTYIKLTLPPVTVAQGFVFRWLNYVGHVIVADVELEIGGMRIDKHYNDWLHIWNELTQTAGKQLGYANMVGNTPTLTFPTEVVTGGTAVTVPSQILYVPLEFWFCRNPGLALPLIALQYHEVKINITFTPILDCIYIGTSTGAGTDPTNLSTWPVAMGSTLRLQASLYVDYIYLDTDERRRFAQVSHEYLIEQLQFTGAETYNSAMTKIKLNFNHPTKELIWVMQPDDVVNTNVIYGKQWYNYTDTIDTAYMRVPTTAAPGNQKMFGQLPNGATQGGGGGTNHVFQDAWFDGGDNTMATGLLQLNGHDRFAVRDSRYFNLVQPYQHHENIPSKGIYVYSFGLKPEEHQPSGTCNFSRIDVAILQLINTAFAQTTAVAAGLMNAKTNTGQVRVYAVNYNVLRIMSGMGGLAYSN